MKQPRSMRSMAALGALALVTLAGALPASAKNDNVPPGKANSDIMRPASPPGQSVTIDIASITDFHGQLKSVWSEECTGEDEEEVCVDILENGGVLGVSGVVETLRAENPQTIFVANGDSVGGSAYESAILEDVPTLELLNAMDLAVSNTGNHEFDKGWLDLRDRIIPLSDFDYLGANIEGTPELKPYSIHRLVGRAGVTVAFIGTLTPELPTLVSPTGIEGITLDGVCDTTNMYADQLSDGRANNGEADVIVALSHYGHASLSQCEFSANVDAALSGHTHDPIITTATRTDGEEIPLVEAENAGGMVAHLQLTYDRKADTVSYDVVENIETEGSDADGLLYIEKYTPEVWAIYDAALAAAEEAGKAVIGAISDDLLRPFAGTRGNESIIGTFLANVALWQGDRITDADFGVINPGGIRANLVYAGDTTDNPLNVDGAVTYAEAFTVQPFGNTMAYIDLTGEQVDLLLEQQWQDGKSRPMLRLGISDNVSYVFDPTRAQFDRVTDIFIDGAPLDPTATYTVAGNSFLLAGGDSFFVFEDGANYVDTGVIDLQSLLDYFAELRELGEPSVQPVLEQASTGFEVNGLEVTISSLMFTNVETAPSTVELFVDGVSKGIAAIDGEVDISVPSTTDPDEDAEARSLVDLTGIATLTLDSPIEAGAEIRILTDDGFTDVTFTF